MPDKSCTGGIYSTLRGHNPVESQGLSPNPQSHPVLRTQVMEEEGGPLQGGVGGLTASAAL